MTHKRVLVRNYLVTLLTGQTAAGSRVYNSKALPFLGTLPAVNLLTLSEKAGEPYQQVPIEQKVDLSIDILAIVQANEGYADTLDSLCEQIENRIDYKLGGLVNSCVYQSTDIDYREEGQKLLAFARISYKAEYLIEEKALTLAADSDDLESIATGWDMAPTDEQIDANDLISNLHI